MSPQFQPQRNPTSQPFAASIVKYFSKQLHRFGDFRHGVRGEIPQNCWLSTVFGVWAQKDTGKIATEPAAQLTLVKNNRDQKTRETWVQKVGSCQNSSWLKHFGMIYLGKLV